MALIIRAFIKFLLGIILLVLFSCKTQEFAKNGYFTGEVDKYFNEKEKLNVWLYRAFQPSDTGNTGLRKDSFYPLDRRMMKMTGLGKKGDKVLFSVVPESKPLYNMIAIKHKKRRFDKPDFVKKEYYKAPYYEKDYSSDGMDIKHVYIPYAEKEGLSLIFYALKVEGRTKDKPVDKFEYLAKINALELFEQKDFKTTWQIFDCEERERLDWTLSPRADLLKDRETIYLKLFDIYGPNKTISFFKLIKKNDVKEIQLKLCPNEYVLEYYDERGMILDKSSFKVVN